MQAPFGMDIVQLEKPGSHVKFKMAAILAHLS
jgi:hypothetical protein